ncbi:MAG: hypothetical protein EBZ49_07025 [Proteobacteria bacterium]|nr:hypothetical protein [Pseudomonadota bacterium]
MSADISLSLVNPAPILVTVIGSTGDLSPTITSGSTAIVTVTSAGGQGQPGPANTLSIGTVTSGATASASITGTAPNQVLNLTLPGVDFSQFATVAKSGSAADLTGTLSADRLPASIPRLVNGVIPASILPSYVDDVVEGTLATFPSPGETGKIYTDVSTNPPSIYRWTGSTYVQIVNSPGTTDAIAEGAFNLYFTNSRAALAAPVQSVAGRTGSITITANDVSGLGALATLKTTGTPSATTYLRGDGTWTAVSTVTSVPWSSITGTPASFTPSAHAASHGAAGSDKITIASTQVTGLGSLATKSPTGTANATTFLRGDNSWALPPGASYTAGAGITFSGNTISAAVTKVAGRTGAVVLTTADVSGLGSPRSLRRALRAPRRS